MDQAVTTPQPVAIPQVLGKGVIRQDTQSYKAEAERLCIFKKVLKKCLTMIAGYAIIISERGRSHWQEYPNLIKPSRESGMRFPKEVFNSEPDREPKGSHFFLSVVKIFTK